MPAADPAMRAQTRGRGGRARGWPALHARAGRASIPAAAARIHANDPQRITRALEVHRAAAARRSATGSAPPARRGLPFRVLRLALAPRRPRAAACAHRARASTRCWRPASSTRCARCCAPIRACIRTCRRCARSATGRRGGTSTATPMRRRSATQAIAATRQLAKRQLTWLRGQPELRWFDPDADRG